MGEHKQFSLFDLDLNHRLAKVKVDPHAKNQGQRSNGSNSRVPTANGHTHTHGQTDGHTHKRYATKRIISPATRSIKIAQSDFLSVS